MRDNPFAHCPGCGQPGPDLHEGRHIVCARCGFEFYINAAAAVGAVIRREDGRILWVARARDPGRGLLDVPGGFVDPGESLEEALCRECREELGTNVHSLKFFLSRPNRYPYRGIEYTTVDAFFFAAVESPIQPGEEEILHVVWARPDELKAEDMAFDSLRGLLVELQSTG